MRTLVARSGSFVRGFRELVAVALDALRPARDEAPIVQETTPDDPRKAPKLRVLIVDDDIRVRRALRSLIECAPDLIVVGEARSTASAKRLDLELLPDVVVLDLLLPQALDGMGVLGSSDAGAARSSPSAARASWGPERRWQERTPFWRSTAGTWTTSST
jgi:hypothetical protein